MEYGYILPTVGGYMSVEEFLCALQAPCWGKYTFVLNMLPTIWGYL